MSIGWYPIDTTDPDKIISLIVPAPIARNPNGSIALGLIVGRQLIDFLWRLAMDDQSRSRIRSDRLCKCLVQWTANQGFDS